MQTRTGRFLRVLGVIIVLLLLGMGGVIVYTSNIVQCSGCGDSSVMVLVSTHDIPPNTKLDPLINHGDFRLVPVPNDLLLEDVVMSSDQIRGLRSRTWIFAREQIPMRRVGEGSCHTPEPGNDCW
jgi:hypothetical protein